MNFIQFRQRTICAVLLLLLLTVSLVLAKSARPADAQIIIDPPPTVLPPPLPAPLDHVKIQEQRVDATINGQLVEVQLSQILRNDSYRPIEGTYLFPLPADAAISDFQMSVNGEVIEGEILRKDEARRIYEEIVRQRRDPALLEYLDRDLFQVSVFPIPAGETRTLTINYTQLLEQQGGLYQFRYPLFARQISAEPIESLILTIELTNQNGLRTIYSPNFTIDIERLSDKRAVVSYEASAATPTGDFTLYFAESEQPVGVNLLSYQPAGEDGYFLMMAAPSVEIESSEIIARDLLMVLDVSGSMQGAKLEQAQAAARYVVEQLHADDRFNLIRFSTGVRLWQPQLQPAEETQKRAAKQWIDEMEAAGSTDINRALLQAIAQVTGDRPTYLIFLTDGLPTQGERDIAQILANVENNSPANVAVRLFTFGVGYDVNTTLLDTLSSDLGGRSSYVRPDERIDEEVSQFYNGISTPVLSNVEVDFTPNQLIEELYPFPLPDLFAGEQLVIAGRYRQPGPITVTLQGNVNGVPRIYDYPNQELAAQGGEPTVARLWAARKIGALLQTIRRNGPEEEVIDAIVELSLQYGIVTPYTSAYVPEPGTVVVNAEGGNAEVDNAVVDNAVPLEQATADELASMHGGEAMAAREQATTNLRQSSGEMAVAMSESVNDLQTADVVASEPETRYVAGKSFVAQRIAHGEDIRTRWVDTTYTADMSLVTVAFGSKCYFDLLDQAELSAWLAVAPELIIVLQGEERLQEGQALLVTIVTGDDSIDTQQQAACPTIIRS